MAAFSLSLCNALDNKGEEVAETVEIRDEQEQSTTCHGRKRIKRDVIRKKKGLRKNAPEISIEEILDKNCCKCAFQNFHKPTVREHFNCLTYDEQNVYLLGLVTRKDTKKSSGHKRKENPAVGKNVLEATC